MKFLSKNRTKLIFMFAIGYPLVIGYLWYLLHLGYIMEMLTGTYPKGPSADFLIYFLPAVVSLFLLPIKPIPYRVVTVAIITFTYLTFMTWPVLAVKHVSYCTRYPMVMSCVAY